MRSQIRRNKNNSVSLKITSDASSVKKGLSKLTTNMRMVASDALHFAVKEAVIRTRSFITDALPDKPRVAKALNESIHFNEKTRGSSATVRSFKQVKGEATYVAYRKTADLAAIYNFGVKGKTKGGAIKGGKTKKGQRRKGVTGGVMIRGGGGVGGNIPRGLSLEKLKRGGGIGGFAMREVSGKTQSWLPLHHVKEIPALNYMQYCSEQTQLLFNFEVARGILSDAVLKGFYTDGLTHGLDREVKRQAGVASQGKKPRRPSKSKKVSGAKSTTFAVKGVSNTKTRTHKSRIMQAASRFTRREFVETNPAVRRETKAAKAMSRFRPGGN